MGRIFFLTAFHGQTFASHPGRAGGLPQLITKLIYKAHMEEPFFAKQGLPIPGKGDHLA